MKYYHHHNYSSIIDSSTFIYHMHTQLLYKWLYWTSKWFAFLQMRDNFNHSAKYTAYSYSIKTMAEPNSLHTTCLVKLKNFVGQFL